MLFQIELEIAKSISCAKSEGTADHCTVTRWLKKFRSGCKNHQARSSRPKTVDSEAVLQVIEENPMNST